MAVYANSFSGAFHFDDFSCIHENPQVRQLWPWAGQVPSRPEIALAGRPVPALLTAVNFALGGLNPFGYHLVNVVLHLLNALLLFAIIRRTLISRSLAAIFGKPANFLAFTAAALWVAHPLNTESVDYVIQRTELLMALGLFASLYCLIRAADQGHSRRWIAAAIGASAFGMASKESMAVAPLLALLYDRSFLARSFRELWKKRGIFHLSLMATWGILLWLVMNNPRVTTAGFQVNGVTSWHYLLTQTQVISHYLRLTIWPAPLVIDYSDWPLVTSWKAVWVPMSALAVAGYFIAGQLRRWTTLGFLGAWVILTLAPTSSIIPIATEFAAERRMYVPLAAITAAFVGAGWWLLRRRVKEKSCHRAMCAVLLLVLPALSAATIERNAVYKTEIGMLQDVIRKRPLNARAYYNLGIVLGEQEDWTASIEAFEQALRISPDFVRARYNLALALERAKLKD